MSLSQGFEGLTRYPLTPPAIPNIPIRAVARATITVRGSASTKTSTGDTANIYGTRYAAKASFEASTPVLNGFDPAIPEPAKAANATGGVMSATIPK